MIEVTLKLHIFITGAKQEIFFKTGEEWFSKIFQGNTGWLLVFATYLNLLSKLYKMRKDPSVNSK